MTLQVSTRHEGAVKGGGVWLGDGHPRSALHRLRPAGIPLPPSPPPPPAAHPHSGQSPHLPLFLLLLLPILIPVSHPTSLSSSSSSCPSSFLSVTPPPSLPPPPHTGQSPHLPLFLLLLIPVSHPTSLSSSSSSFWSVTPPASLPPPPPDRPPAPLTQPCKHFPTHVPAFIQTSAVLLATSAFI